MRALLVMFITVTAAIASFSNAFYGLLLYAWYSIFSPVDFIWWNIGISNVNLSFGVAAITIITAFTQRRRVLLFDKNTSAALIFLLICYASLVVRADVSASTWNQWWLLARIVFMMFITTALIDNIQKLKIYIIAVAVYTGLLGAYYGYTGLISGATWITGPGTLGGGRFGDNNGYAAWLCVTLPIIWFAGLNMKNKYWRAFSKFIFLGNILAVILTFSRSGAIVASCVLILIFFALKHKGLYFVFLMAFLTAMVLMVSTPRYSTEGLPTGVPTAESVEDATGPARTFEGYKKRTGTIKAYEKDISAVSRRHFWHVATVMGNENPFLGVGFTRFSANYNMYDDSDGAFGVNRAVHNTWCDLFSGTGYVGLISYIFIFIAAFTNINLFVSWIKREKLGVAEEFISYANMMRIGLIAYALGAIFVNTFFHDIFWNMLAICAAMANIAKTGALEYKGNMKWERYIWGKL